MNFLSACPVFFSTAVFVAALHRNQTSWDTALVCIQDPAKRNKKSKSPIGRWQAALKTKGSDVSFANSPGVSRTRSGVRERERRSRAPPLEVVAAVGLLALHGKTEMARSRSGKKGDRNLQSSTSVARSGKKLDKQGKSAPGGDVAGMWGVYGGDDALGSDLDENFDDSGEEFDEDDLIDAVSLGESSAEPSEVSIEEDEEPEEDIEQVLAAMEAEENWDEEDSEPEDDDDDAHVPDAENMNQEELQAAREQRRRDKEERKAARKLARKQAKREERLRAHEEKMAARYAMNIHSHHERHCTVSRHSVGLSRSCLLVANLLLDITYLLQKIRGALLRVYELQGKGEGSSKANQADAKEGSA